MDRKCKVRKFTISTFLQITLGLSRQCLLYTLGKIPWLYLHIFRRSATNYSTGSIFKFTCVFPISEIQILILLTVSTNILKVTMSDLPLVKLYSYHVLWKYVISYNMHTEGTCIETELNNKRAFPYKVRKVVIRLLSRWNIEIRYILLRCMFWYISRKAYRLFTGTTSTDFFF
jgi:hypothetical protein